MKSKEIVRKYAIRYKEMMDKEQGEFANNLIMTVGLDISKDIELATLKEVLNDFPHGVLRDDRMIDFLIKLEAKIKELEK